MISRTSLEESAYIKFVPLQETTSTTLNFLVLYLLLDQRVQQKMQKELDGFCIEKEERNETEGKGAKMMIKTADRPKLPYVNAVINVGDRKADMQWISVFWDLDQVETFLGLELNPFLITFQLLPLINWNEAQQMCNLLPLNLPHRTLADVQIVTGRGANFRLGRGTIIVPQISCVLFDEQVHPALLFNFICFLFLLKVFPNSRRFLPERFLNQKGQLERFEELILFGFGKRWASRLFTFSARKPFEFENFNSIF
ncbi:hypothetical protein niasHT_036094 [Heterodera trifolii]|uniref:Uncharacterized protein n=1 Tax=Heterodera trifolii TaxID=157864 RepID=A0ABD2HXM6_9BILA